jgi:hypothetical protein
MQQAVWEQRLLLFAIACHGLLVWRLWSQKLTGVYVFLTVFLAAETVQDLLALTIRARSTLYGWFFLLSTPIIWILAYFVVLELYRLILEDYPGIASAGRKAVTWCLGLALIVSFAYAIPELRTSQGRFPVLRVYYVAERSTVLALLLFLVLIQLFLFRYHLRLSSNRIVYATGYALYFGIGVAQDIIYIALGIRVIDRVTLWMNLLAAVLLLAGTALLSSRGEVKAQLETIDSSSDRARLQRELSDINRLLSKAARGGG